MSLLTDQFTEAFEYAALLHRRQIRKGQNIPYLGHLMRVAGIVLECGGDEETAIAALLHDAVEDQGGMTTADVIEAKFGPRVRTIVLECSDSTSDGSVPKRPWQERKQNYIEHLQVAGEEARLVSAADKLDNMSTTWHNIIEKGDKAFSIFKTGKEGQKWYLGQVVRIFVELNSPLAVELKELYEKIFKTPVPTTMEPFLSTENES